jgi:glutamyl-tRNA synthetase
LHETPFAEVADRLAALAITGGEDFWTVIRGNLIRLADARIWWQIVTGTVDPVGVDGELTARAADLLPPEPWDAATWPAWTDAVRAATGRSGKALFMPLRLALTGLDHGPELRGLLPLIGRAKALARLRGRAA